jgi:hypothetical protein
MSAEPYRNDLHQLMSQPESWFTDGTFTMRDDGVVSHEG